jgi:type II secretory pathway pseudopilin PulG
MRGVRGYALMMALVALVGVSLAAAVAVQRAGTEARREREEQLLWVGGQYRRALQNYYAVAATAGGRQQFPEKLEDLLQDARTPAVARHLRRLYTDPMTGKNDWVLEVQAGRITGLHSASAAVPLRHAGFGPGNDAFAQARSYAEWRFLGTDPMAAEAAALPASAGTPPGSPGTDPSPASPPPPSPPPDPNAVARTQCYELYGSPNLRCTASPLPMGTDAFSCFQQYSALLRQCLAQVNSN